VDRRLRINIFLEVKRALLLNDACVLSKQKKWTTRLIMLTNEEVLGHFEPLEAP
jgi:hypothetical protein